MRKNVAVKENTSTFRRGVGRGGDYKKKPKEVPKPTKGRNCFDFARGRRGELQRRGIDREKRSLGVRKSQRRST